jgi:hypothetical protein
MTKPKNPDTRNPQVDTAANQGEVNTQTLKHAQKAYKDNVSDQSEGARAEGQPTAMHGKGAGFSRNTR